MVLRGLGHWWGVMLDCWAILATAKAVWVFLSGLGHLWEVLHDGSAILASA